MADRWSGADQSRLLEFLASKHLDDEFTFERLMEVAYQDDPARVAESIATLVNHGHLEQFVRVESTLGNGGINDFPNMLAVPEKIFDWRTGLTVNVTLDNLRVMYRLPQPKPSAPTLEGTSAGV